MVGGRRAVVRLELTAACSWEFWALSDFTCWDREAIASASPPELAAGETVVGVWPSWDWMTLAAALIRC